MKHPCPSCGYLVFDERPGSYEICPLCSWQDDPISLALATVAIGANHVSLVEAQRNFADFGAVERRCTQWARRPGPKHERAPDWFPIPSEMIPNFPTLDEQFEYPEDDSKLYYWKEDYFRNESR